MKSEMKDFIELTLDAILYQNTEIERGMKKRFLCNYCEYGPWPCYKNYNYKDCKKGIYNHLKK